MCVRWRVFVSSSGSGYHHTRRGCRVCEAKTGFCALVYASYSRSDLSSPLWRSSLSCLVQPARRSRRTSDTEPKTTSLGVRDATAVDLGRVKSENAALEGQRDRTDATAAAASAAAATANADAAAAAEDAEDAQDTLGYQVRFTDALQTKIDELAALAKANGVDAAAVDAIKNRANL